MAAMRDLEKEYDPTQWSKRFSNPKELLESHVKFGREVSNSNRHAINCHLNISYGNSSRQKLDIYGADLPESSPVMVFIHGGYWQGMNKFTSAYAVKPFVDAGVKVVSVDHDLCPDVTLEEVVKQFQNAAEFIINQAVAHGSKSVSFVGHLSGAHLITFILQKDFIERIGVEKFKVVKNVFLISGIYDLKELKDTKCANRDNLLSLTESNVATLSPINANFDDLKESSIKLFTFVGGDESPTFHQQSEDFSKHLSSFGLNPSSKKVENVDHFNIVEKLSEDDYKITKLILSNL